MLQLSLAVQAATRFAIRCPDHPRRVDDTYDDYIGGVHQKHDLCDLCEKIRTSYAPSMLRNLR